jgi:hypothetical protein
MAGSPTTAHRGYPRPDPANVAATDAARIAQGLDMVDADVQALADGLAAQGSALTAAAAAAATARMANLMCGTAGGAANALILTPSPPITSYSGVVTIHFVPPLPNTGPATVDVSGVGVRAVRTAAGAALSPNAWAGGDAVAATLVGGEFRMAGGSALPAVRGPAITAPAAGATGVSRWPTITTSAYGSLYTVTHVATQIQVSTVSDFGSTVVDTTLGALVSWTCTTELAKNTLFHARARHKNADGVWSDWSATVSFTTINSTIATPSITSPANGATGVLDQPVITASAYSCSDAQVTHLNTDWQLSTSNTFATTAWQSLADAVNKTSVQIPAATLQTSTVYYVRFRYRGSDGSEVSGWSNAVSFATASAFATTFFDTVSGSYSGFAISGTEVLVFGGGVSPMNVARGSVAGTTPNIIDYRSISGMTGASRTDAIRVTGAGTAFLTANNDYTGGGTLTLNFVASDLSSATGYDISGMNTYSSGKVLAAAPSSSEVYVAVANMLRRYNTSGTCLASAATNTTTARNCYWLYWDGAYLWGLFDRQGGSWFGTLVRMDQNFGSMSAVDLGDIAGFCQSSAFTTLPNGNLAFALDDGGQSGYVYIFVVVPSTMALVSCYKLTAGGSYSRMSVRQMTVANGSLYLHGQMYNGSIWHAFMAQLNATATSVAVQRKLTHSTGGTGFSGLAYVNGNLYAGVAVNGVSGIFETNLSLGNATGALPNHSGASWSAAAELSMASTTFVLAGLSSPAATFAAANAASLGARTVSAATGLGANTISSL